MKTFIQTTIRKYLTEAYVDKNNNLIDFRFKDLVDFDSFPESVRQTLDDEYGNYTNNFDWNEKQDEFRGNPEGLKKWFEKNKSEAFLKNINNIIRMTTQDMILIKKQKIAQLKLKSFEELIIPSLGNDVLVLKLSKFEEDILMDPNATIKSIENGFKEAKNIIDSDGSINQRKIQMSQLFTGDDINIPAFENFIKKNPEYQSAFNDWKRLFDEEMELSFKELNAYRDTTPIQKIRELRNFLINFKKTH